MGCCWAEAFATVGAAWAIVYFLLHFNFEIELDPPKDDS